ncbi:hypothetical protein LTR99_003968 [Exophiala xenobiotica]|uniref:Defect at low temperature protein 1 n=1 Tax=Vermiconidia calcicola TaxID=1690605 RepID=A0AAV9PXI2_9PEZI|nr:hypothetical protein LTR99_003968 [Exophiala xenobiotica]KAK5435435.1 hypothetical protein LTR34_002939 [Exophiala xenobiotica]KAK5529714.1 hypothetical protein LTR25_009493 [Vermiconidia calcicola]KAK5549082.1 hypothetical protein LTR23_000912 [Chaetothyriales sp. CCFEE 6169]KAK5557183.1 hypothetical protein LTR46_004994 [Exophiala xenobiotica]
MLVWCPTRCLAPAGSTSFTIVFLLTISFICVTPADAIYESYKRRRLLDIFLITGDYVVTALIASLIYASRLYTNRSVLKDIPKTFMPIEKEDLPGRRVHRLIQDCLERSAVIAYQARPKSKRIEHDNTIGSGGARSLVLASTNESKDHEPTWGKVEHPGWCSPAAADHPGLEYATVIDELIDLVEAKAVSLAPVDPLGELGPDGSPLPDPRVIDELTRLDTMGMRQYLRRLIEIGVVPDTSLSAAFLTAYERARFSSRPLTDDEFQGLMRMFAELLRNMAPVDVDMLDLEDLEASAYTSPSEAPSMIHHHHHHHDNQRRPSTHTDPTVSSSAASTFSGNGSVRHRPPPPRRVSEDSAPSLSSVERKYTAQNEDDEDDDMDDGRSLRTAPTTRATSARSRPRLGSSSRMASAVSRQSSLRSTNSSGSLRSDLGPRRTRTRSSASGGSVIRLTRPSDRSELPYTIRVPQHAE